MDKKMMAKSKMLRELKKAMMEELGAPLGEKMKDMKKVTVASDSEEGLEEGLSKAQQILQKKSEMEDMDEDEHEDDEMSMLRKILKKS
jgi:hypothetical protein